MSYERLTRKRNDGTYYVKKCNETYCDGYCSCCDLGFDEEIRERLGQLEDKIENGTLLYKICKDGYEVYIIAKQGLDIYSVEKVMIVDFWYSKQDKCLYAIDSDGALHREVYATEQEAEEKLRELRGEKE